MDIVKTKRWLKSDFKGGDRRVNNSNSIGTETTKEKLSGKRYKNESNPIYGLWEQFFLLLSVLTPIEYKKRQKEKGHYIHWKICK